MWLFNEANLPMISDFVLSVEYPGQQVASKSKHNKNLNIFEWKYSISQQELWRLIFEENVETIE